MEQATEAKTYSSPPYKLIGFFHGSRDGWRKKAIDRNARIRTLEKRVVGLEESRRKWKEKAKARQAEVARLREELEEQKGVAR